jgi:hypothetical protein
VPQRLERVVSRACGIDRHLVLGLEEGGKARWAFHRYVVNRIVVVQVEHLGPLEGHGQGKETPQIVEDPELVVQLDQRRKEGFPDHLLANEGGAQTLLKMVEGNDNCSQVVTALPKGGGLEDAVDRDSAGLVHV